MIKHEMTILMSLIMLGLITSCQYMPEILRAAEEVALETEINVEMNKKAMKEDVNTKFHVNVPSLDFTQP